MEKTSVTLRIFFEEPFWIGCMERLSEDKLSVSKTVFGAEPKDGEVYAWVLGSFDRLRFSPAIEAAAGDSPMHFKKRVREVRRQMQNAGIGTRSQQALSLQRDQMKTERRSIKMCIRDRQYPEKPL